ncbi:MAG TPA: GNAT family protein [Coleofasciculaceae cyanobacterium]
MQDRTWQSPEWMQLQGQFVTLSPLVLDRDVTALYAASHGTVEKEALWNYLPYGPFEHPLALRNWMEKERVGQANSLPWTVFENSTKTQVGNVGLLAIAPSQGCAEIGDVWFTPAVQKSKVNTESQYLLLRHLFDHHSYRRAEWKCNSLNHASRTTAARMGFTYEGRFRQHMWVKGKNRDTDWFAMTDKDWPRCKSNFERWLYSDEKISLMELNNG